jgi:2-keto-4-pentenoate hydratase/2-oxohepta-3-ene-1,7-dioic acid hydratase in catechol pathway
MKSIHCQADSFVPSKIICVGRNYTEHALELGNAVPDTMVLFLTPNSSVSTSLMASHLGEQLQYEGEICYLVRGKRFVAVGLGLDLTKRGLQSRLKAKGLPWERAKAFDGSAVLGPFVPLEDPWMELTIRLHINGVLRQQGATSQMLFPPQQILAEIQSFLTLEDGDVVMTGTPAGVGKVLSGDRFHLTLHHQDRELAAVSWTALP